MLPVLRLLLIAALLLPVSAFAARRDVLLREMAQAQPLTFYVVKGAADACGAGCDRWVVIEGTVDNAASSRFRGFLKRLGREALPFYLHSPGGNLKEALAIGQMLRERKAVARVGRTTVADCGFEAQDGAACLKLKQGDLKQDLKHGLRALRGDLWTRGAICNSACPYLLLGAVTREVAPDASLAVHSPHVSLSFTGAAPPREIRAKALQAAMERSDRMVLDYLARMGVDVSLLTLARSVKFEDSRFLSRDEIAAFGIDRRDRVETPWAFEQFSRGVIYKTLLERSDAARFRSTRLQLLCLDSGQVELQLQRVAPAGSTQPGITLSGGKLSLALAPTVRTASGPESWYRRLAASQVAELGAEPEITLVESDMIGREQVRSAHKFGTEGLPGAVQKLLATCPAAKPRADVAAK